MTINLTEPTNEKLKPRITVIGVGICYLSFAHGGIAASWPELAGKSSDERTRALTISHSF